MSKSRHQQNYARLHLTDAPHTLCLVLVDDCNLACTYCPYRLEPSGQMMTEDVARKALIEWSQDTLPDTDRYLLLYGGEPLMNIHTMRAAIETTRNLDALRGTSILVPTNGSLLTTQLVEYFSEHGVSLVFGLDGTDSRSNADRVSRGSREGTLPGTLSAIHMAINGGLTVYASMMLTPLSLSSAQFTLQCLQQLGVAGVGCNLLKGADLLTTLELHSWTIEMYVEGVTSFFGILSRSALKHYERTVNQWLERLSGHITQPDCLAYGDQRVLAPDGRESACALNSRLSAPVSRTRLPSENPACSGCSAAAICGGGCAAHALYATGNALNIDPVNCTVTKGVYAQLTGPLSHA